MTENGRDTVRALVDTSFPLSAAIIGFYWGLVYDGTPPAMADWVNFVGACLVLSVVVGQLYIRKWTREESKERRRTLDEASVRADSIMSMVDKNVQRVMRKAHSFPLFSFGSEQTAVHLADVAAIESDQIISETGTKHMTRVYLTGGSFLDMEGNANVMRDVWLKYLVASSDENGA